MQQRNAKHWGLKPLALLGKPISLTKIQNRLDRIRTETDPDVRRTMLRALYRITLDAIRRGSPNALELASLALHADKEDPDIQNDW